MMTPCVCDRPGYCPRHQCHKSPHWWRLCQSRPDLFLKWEEGNGPGQNTDQSADPFRPDSPTAATVLMVTYNRLDYTKLAVDALLASDHPLLDIVIWDNASTDGTREWLAEQFLHDERVALVLSNRNTGCTHPMNVVWGTVRTPLVAKVDNDTLVPPHLLSELSHLLSESSQLGVVSGCHYRSDDMQELDQVNSDGEQRILRRPHVGGCAVMMRRKVFTQFGPIVCQRLSSETPYLESGWTDYQHRLTQAGYLNGYPLPLIYVDHMEDIRSEHCLQTEEHETYKKAMRGQSLQACTTRHYVKGAQTTVRQGTVETLRVRNTNNHRIGDVTFFIPLSGRATLWPRLAAFLRRQTWPREKTSLILMDTSQDDAFHHLIRQWTNSCDYPNVRLLREAVGEPGIADQPRRAATPAVKAAVSRIYNRLAGITETEFTWILEDDILPPDDVCSQLLQHFDNQTGSVAAPYRSRFGDRYVVWNHHGRNDEQRGRGVANVGGHGLGCAVVRSHILRNIHFPNSEDCDRFLSQRIHELEMFTRVDWSCICQHGVNPEEGISQRFRSTELIEVKP